MDNQTSHRELSDERIVKKKHEMTTKNYFGLVDIGGRKKRIEKENEEMTEYRV
jgi:hypothetical protein